MTNSKGDGMPTPNSSELSHERHKARAMLLGMIYHHGNGDGPFYYKLGEDGIPETESMLDAVTLEPLVIKDARQDGSLTYRYNGPDVRNLQRRHNMMWDGSPQKPRKL